MLFTRPEERETLFIGNELEIYEIIIEKESPGKNKWKLPGAVTELVISPFLNFSPTHAEEDLGITPRGN